MDERVGKENYLVALSADHGMMDMPEYLKELGIPARRITEEEVNTAVKNIRAVAASQSSGNRDEAAAKVTAAVKQYDFVADVMTPQQLLGKTKTSDLFLALQRNSYSADRIPHFPFFDTSDGTSPSAELGLAVRLKKWMVVDFDRGVHGSPYEYDRNVPLIFMGAGVRAGTSDKSAHTTDVAPTLAALAGIPFPKNLDGRSLLINRSQKTRAPLKKKK